MTSMTLHSRMLKLRKVMVPIHPPGTSARLTPDQSYRWIALVLTVAIIVVASGILGRGP